MSFTQILIGAGIASVLVLSAILSWKAAAGQRLEAIASAAWNDMPHSGWRGAHLCADRDPSEHLDRVFAFARAGLGLDAAQAELLKGLEPQITALIAKVRTAACVAGPQQTRTPERLAALARGVDLVAEELHMLQPAVARFYESLDDEQRQILDEAIRRRRGK